MSTINTFTDSYSELILSGVQEYSDKKMVSYGISDVSTTNERIVKNRFNSSPVATRGTDLVDYTSGKLRSLNDQLEVNETAIASERLATYEINQTTDDLEIERSDRLAASVRDAIDQYVLGLPVSFSGVANLDNGTFSGGASDGAAYQITNSNADEVTDDIVEAIDLNDAPIEKGRFMVATPTIIKRISNYLKNTGNDVGDDTIERGFATILRGENGYTGKEFGGLSVFQSNNLKHEVVLGLATNPTDGDTITFELPGNGGARVSTTITFVATLSGGAGEVHIASAVDTTAANLAEYLNAFGANDEAEAANTGYSALAAANQDALQRSRITATANAGADTVTITTEGTLKVSETLTASADTFGDVGVHCLAGVMGGIDLYLPENGMEMTVEKMEGKRAYELMVARTFDATIWEYKKGHVYDVFLKV